MLITLLGLLARLTANSTSSGHTPPTLSPLFGPLLFGLGPAALAFHHTYTHYLRAAHAMEHLQLVFIRWQDATSTAALGVPVRLKDWIKGYPAMLPSCHHPASPANQKPQPRRGVRTVRLMTVRRNVRMYSPDLVKTAASWADSSAPSKNGLLVSKEWARIAPPTLKLPPRYSDAYRKRMNMPPNFHPDTGALAAPSLNASSSSSSYGSSLTSSDNNDYFALGTNSRTGDDRFRSLTDLKWGEFESMGFSGLEDDKKLQFDLTESARTVSFFFYLLFSSVMLVSRYVAYHGLFRNVPRSASLCHGQIFHLQGSLVLMLLSAPRFSSAPLSPRPSPRGRRTMLSLRKS